MSILIKGMEMPQNCFDCLMSSFGLCNLIEGEPIGNPQKRLDNCPLVPVPEHGRLIDASEKIKVQMYDDMTEDYHMVEMTIDDFLCQGWVEANAPTIIEAEEKKHDQA